MNWRTGKITHRGRRCKAGAPPQPRLHRRALIPVCPLAQPATLEFISRVEGHIARFELICFPCRSRARANNRFCTSRFISHVETRQPGVHLLAPEQRREIRRVVGHERVAIVNGTTHDRPILARAEPEPCDMRRFAMAAFTRKRNEARAQAFVDQEFHARAKSSKARVSEALGGRDRRDDFARGRPRCG